MTNPTLEKAARAERIAIVFDGERWHVRRIREIEHDLDRDEKVYRCDEPISSGHATLADVPEVAEIATAAISSALLEPSDEVVSAVAQAMLDDIGNGERLDMADEYRRVISVQLSSADLLEIARAALRAAVMKITGKDYGSW